MAAEPPGGSAAGPQRGVSSGAGDGVVSSRRWVARVGGWSRRVVADGARGRCTRRSAGAAAPAPACALHRWSCGERATTGWGAGCAGMWRTQPVVGDRLRTPHPPRWTMRRTQPDCGDRLGTPHRRGRGCPPRRSSASARAWAAGAQPCCSGRCSGGVVWSGGPVRGRCGVGAGRCGVGAVRCRCGVGAVLCACRRRLPNSGRFGSRRVASRRGGTRRVVVAAGWSGPGGRGPVVGAR